MRLLRSLSVAFALTQLAALAQDLPHVPVARNARGIEYRTDQLLVRFRVGTASDTLAAARALVATTDITSYSLVPGLERLTIGADLESALKSLAALPCVLYAEPDYVVHHVGVPNDSLFGSEWGMHNTGQTVNGSVGVVDADIDGPEAWDVSTGGAAFVVAIIDTGTQWSHPDLDGNIWVNPRRDRRQWH
ncbi:MAG: hypothetical protein U1E76_06860 [Planctomycetota bacterium]